MKITTLVENHVYNAGLLAKNGLSIHIDTDKKYDSLLIDN